ncbi:MAG: hypothetical protein HYX24_05300 [Candidatus Aenigmarchaeota archaeon]|nr:hypothetical protein [Candidatus Aenigmarchaeota archaeon]
MSKGSTKAAYIAMEAWINEDGTYIVHAKDGFITTESSTYEELRESVREAVDFYLEDQPNAYNMSAGAPIRISFTTVINPNLQGAAKVNAKVNRVGEQYTLKHPQLQPISASSLEGLIEQLKGQVTKMGSLQAELLLEDEI